MDLGTLREAVATALEAIPNLSVFSNTQLTLTQEDDSAYVVLGSQGIQPSGHQGMLDVALRVVVVVQRATVKDAELGLDPYLWPSGTQSIAQAVLADRTLGGIVEDIMWINAGAPYGAPEGSPTSRQSEVQFIAILEE